jgi:spore germination protein
MIVSPKDRITTPQAAVIISNFILGSGILTLPRTAAEKVNTPDVWISVILGGLIAIIAGVIMVKLCLQFPQKTIYQYSREIVGKWVGGLLSLLIVCYFLLTSGFQLRSMAEVIRYFLLEGTPIWAIMMPFMWVGLYLIIGGINPIARLFEIVLPITIFLFLLVAFLSLKIFEIDNLRPVLGTGFIPVLKGVKATTLAFTGPEVLLVIMRTWPTLDLIRSFEVTGLIFERFDSLLLVVWIMQMFTTFTISYYVGALGLAQLSKKNISSFMYGLLPLIYVISITPKNINDLFKLGDMISNFALFLFGLLPLLLLIIARWKGRKQ